MFCVSCLDGELQVVVSSNGWTVDNGIVHIRSQEEHVKPKRILPRIDFESEPPLLACKNHFVIAALTDIVCLQTFCFLCRCFEYHIYCKNVRAEVNAFLDFLFHVIS